MDFERPPHMEYAHQGQDAFVGQVRHYVVADQRDPGLARRLLGQGYYAVVAEDGGKVQGQAGGGGPAVEAS